MSFAELSQSVEVVRGAEAAVPAGDGLPISRREYVKWIGEIENLVPRPVCIGQAVNGILCFSLSVYLDESCVVGLFIFEDGMSNRVREYSKVEIGATSTSLFLRFRC
uniref:Uncharacterized protein n=1 Tax=Parascaris equorum TaxID=6256 RepID=A0A914RZ29_PAREQ